MIDTLAQVAGHLVLKIHLPLFVALPMIALCEKLIPKFPLQSDQIRRMREDKAFDIAEAQRELGFAPRSFERGIRDALHKTRLKRRIDE